MSDRLLKMYGRQKGQTTSQSQSLTLFHSTKKKLEESTSRKTKKNMENKRQRTLKQGGEACCPHVTNFESRKIFSLTSAGHDKKRSDHKGARTTTCESHTNSGNKHEVK